MTELGDARGAPVESSGAHGVGTVAIRPRRRGDPSALSQPDPRLVKRPETSAVRGAADPPRSPGGGASVGCTSSRPAPEGRETDPRTATAKLQRNLELKRESVDRLSLFTATFLGARAPELLGGLVPSAAATAQALAEQVAGLDSMMRKARAARAFGERVDAPQRVRGLLQEAHGLEGELVAKLPPYLVAGTHRVPHSGPGAACPGRTALLDRLIREASR